MLTLLFILLFESKLVCGVTSVCMHYVQKTFCCIGVAPSCTFWKIYILISLIGLCARILRPEHVTKQCFEMFDSTNRPSTRILMNAATTCKVNRDLLSVSRNKVIIAHLWVEVNKKLCNIIVRYVDETMRSTVSKQANKITKIRSIILILNLLQHKS